MEMDGLLQRRIFPPGTLASNCSKPLPAIQGRRGANLFLVGKIPIAGEIPLSVGASGTANGWWLLDAAAFLQSTA